ncbi:hypothetical protein ABK040_004941 [Willaertia magna]
MPKIKRNTSSTSLQETRQQQQNRIAKNNNTNNNTPLNNNNNRNNNNIKPNKRINNKRIDDDEEDEDEEMFFDEEISTQIPTTTTTFNNNNNNLTNHTNNNLNNINNNIEPEPPSNMDKTSIANIKQLAKRLSQGQRVLFITGAGLSVSSGIPTYRGSSNSIWSKFIMEYGTRKCFQSDPLDWYNTFWLQTHHRKEYLIAKPNEGHLSISKISKCCNIKVITQNIDHLHSKTSLNHVIEVHGRLGLYKCINQRRKQPCIYSKSHSINNLEITNYSNDFEKLNTSINNNNNLNNNNNTFTIQQVPKCPSCNKPILPQTLLFDEKYESHDFYQWTKALEWIYDCDLYVFVGTSFSVGVTHECVNVALNEEKEMYNFNLTIDNEIKELDLFNIIGKSEQTLPYLYNLIQYYGKVGNNGKPRMYFYNKHFN